ncbi:MAG: hypothetical protein EBU13_10800, partial [Synechococcaceae bacterium WB5_2A_257]|nr:hypothetical protein [Synechococcaceae bacterium WB5_2A_257]
MFRIQFRGKRAGLEIGHGLRWMQTPGDPRGRISPRLGFATHLLAQFGIHQRFLARRTKAESIKVGSILAIELLRNLHQYRHALRGGHVAHAQGDFATHRGGGIGGHFCGKFHHVGTGETQGAQGDQPLT